MKRLRSYIRRYWHRYSFGILCTIVTATLLTLIPRLSGMAINAIQRSDYARLERVSLLMIAAALMMGVVRWFSRFTIFNCGRDVEFDLRNDLFAHLARLGPDFYERLKTGDLMSRMINDLGNVRLMVGMAVLSFVNTPVTFAMALGMMISISGRLSAAAMLPYAALFFEMRWLTHTLMERSTAVQEGLAAIGSRVQESLSGIHVIKSYTLEDHDADRFREVNEDYNDQSLALARIRGAMVPMIKSTVGTSVMIVLIYGSYLIRGHLISIGDMVAFMLFLGQLAWPTVSIGWTLSLYQRGRASMKRLDDIFDAVPVPGAAATEVPLQVAGAIEWEHVSFSYFAPDGISNGSISDDSPLRTWALRDISVKVPAGGKLAIVGRTGSGKSTMVRLLARLIDPTDGRILLDDRDIRELPLGELRRVIGMVPQEPALFSDTIARNIAFGRGDATKDQIKAASHVAGLDSDIDVMPRGLETVVGERGMSLSGGQKQRLT
ncbi:MAG: ABC transporter ATP-binding protein, partial [Candidatus Binataceae bacterium]